MPSKRRGDPCCRIGKCSCYIADRTEETEFAGFDATEPVPSALTLARKELENVHSQLEGAKAELVEVLNQSVQTAQLEMELQKGKWFNAKATAHAQTELEMKERLLKRVQKVLLRSKAFAKPKKGTTVVIQTNNFTTQVCPTLIGKPSCIALADDANSLYTVEGCEFWLRRIDFNIQEGGSGSWDMDTVSTASGSSDSESSSDDDGGSTCDDDAQPSNELAAALTGCWVLDRCEGNMSDLMADAGVDWVTQRTAKSFNYGAGLVKHTVEQSGKKLCITMTGGLKTLKTKIDMSSDAPSETQAEDGSEILVTGRWEGNALVIAGKSKKTGKEIQTSKRYLQGQELVQEVFPLSSKYSPVKRVFKLK